MKSLGIECDSKTLIYVLVEGKDGDFNVIETNRLTLSGTRSREALAAFQDAIRTLFTSTAPDVVGIKEKPETGKMRAGAASLKMEGIVLANAPCEVLFVSGAKINRCAATDASLFGYFQPALKAAVIAGKMT